MRKMRTWVHTRLGALMGLTAGLLFLAAVTVVHAADEPQKCKPAPQAIQGQQLCPGTPGSGACKVILDCPTAKKPGKTTCQATIDCPGTKQPVTTKQKPIVPKPGLQ